MILVKIELISAIHPSRDRELGRMVITNTGKVDKYGPRRADYNVMLMRKGTTEKVIRTSLVKDYPRIAYTVWELVRRALEATLGKWPIHPGRPEEFDEEVRGTLEEGPTFEQVWSKMEAQGYQYGPEALEQVRFGWELAHGGKP